MSADQPPAPGGMQPTPPARRGIFDQFKGLKWWEIALSILPLGLVALGGLVGAVIGVVGLIGNLAIARSRWSTAARVAAMIGVVVLCYVAIVIIATIVYVATHPTT